MAGLNNPVLAIVFDNTTLYDGVAASPAAYTDLDLSSVVGSKEALVLIEIERGANDCGFLGVRTNGDTRDRSDAFCYGDIHTAGQAFFRLLTTDSAGKIEWFTAAAVTLVVIKMVAYLV